MQKINFFPIPHPFPRFLVLLVLFSFSLVLFWGFCVCVMCLLKFYANVFSIEIYCCSCQHSLSDEGKGMWIVGRLEVRGRWELGRDCFLLYPIPRWAQIAVFLWQPRTLSDMAKQTGCGLHIAVMTSLFDTSSVSLRSFQNWKGPENTHCSWGHHL